MREPDTVSQLVTGPHYSVWALFADALHFPACSRFPHSLLGEFKVSACLYTIVFGRVIGQTSERESTVAAPRRDSTFPPRFATNSGSSVRSHGSMCVFCGFFSSLFSCPVSQSLMAIISGNTSLLSHAQHLQRFFTLMSSPETLRNKESVSYHAHFRDENQKDQKRCEQSQVTELRRGQDGTRPQMLCFRVHGPSHTYGSRYMGPVCNSSNASQL